MFNLIKSLFFPETKVSPFWEGFECAVCLGLGITIVILLLNKILPIVAILEYLAGC